MIIIAISGNVIARVGADTRGLTRGLNNAQRSLNNWQRASNRTMNLAKKAMIGATLAISASFVVIAKNSIKTAMTFEASMQQINRIMGNNANEFTKWANDNANNFNMSQADAIKYGSVFGNLISSISSDTKFITKNTQDLLKATAIVSSATGRTMEDALERIRSGLLGNTEAVEDLGIFVNVSMIESTEAFRKFAGDKSWQQLNFQTQQQIRLMAILEQASKKYGDEVNSNTSSALAKLTATLKDVSLNIGNAFLPIVNIVVPILTSLAERLKLVTGLMAQFSQVLFGSSQEQQNNSRNAMATAKAQTQLGSAIKKAGAEAKRGVAGFDEVNNLQEEMADSDIGSNVGGTDTNIPSMADINIKEIIPQNILDAAKKLRDNWGPKFKEIGVVLNDLRDSLSDLWKNPFVQATKLAIEEVLIRMANYSVNNATTKLRNLNGAIKLVDGVLSGDFSKAVEGAEGILSGFYTKIKDKFLTIFPEMETKITSAENVFKESWSKFKDYIKQYGDPARLELSDFTTFFKNSFELMKRKSAEKFYNLKSDLEIIWGQIKQITWGDVKDAVLLSWDTLKTESSIKWNLFKESLSKKWNEFKTDIKWDYIENAVVTSFKALSLSTITIWDGIKQTIKDSINFAIRLINKFIDQVKSIEVRVPQVTIPLLGTFGGQVLKFPNIPNIPELARGGIVSSPTLATIGEAGTEAVIPLENTSFVDTLAGAIGNAVLSAMQFNQPQAQNDSEMKLIIDSTELARVMIPAINRENSRIGNTIIQGI